ncbi:MAG: hypothetical protein EOP94_03125 [Zymomonas sp.]|nr:MAG: hypothetical protein EOP94_03125 [Zymomonas sp.]
MERCESGAGRMNRMLPAGTVVAHKTGTLGGTVNDVGMTTLPNGRGRLVIAIYFNVSDASEALRERAIAGITRSVFDYFCHALGSQCHDRMETNPAMRVR